MLKASYQNLSEENPLWGRVAVLPWDSEVFGFAVGDYKAGEPGVLFAQREEVAAAFAAWARENAVELVGCSIPASKLAWRVVLPLLGFCAVDSTFHYTIKKVQSATLPDRLLPIRLATAEDQAGVERIAQHAFRAGRYHADPRFPLELANRRYRRWLTDAFASLGPDNRVYLTGEPGNVIGFIHVTVNGQRGYMTIGGGATEVQSTLATFNGWLGMVHAIGASGVRRLDSKLSAANTPMINLAIYAGARFSQPEHVYHWHAPAAPHLLSVDAAAALA